MRKPWVAWVFGETPDIIAHSRYSSPATLPGSPCPAASWHCLISLEIRLFDKRIRIARCGSYRNRTAKVRRTTYRRKEKRKIWKDTYAIMSKKELFRKKRWHFSQNYIDSLNIFTWKYDLSTFILNVNEYWISCNYIDKCILHRTFCQFKKYLYIVVLYIPMAIVY